MGLSSRYQGGQDFFEEIGFQFYSSAKVFEGRVKLNEAERLELVFLGEKRELDFSGFIDFIAEESVKYDRLQLRYAERGSRFLLEADDKKVLTKNEEQKSPAKEDEVRGRSSYIKPSKAQRLLKEIGLMSEEGKLKNDKIRKYHQIDYFVEVIDPILQRFKDRESITILDSGCGKSYLSFVLNHYIKEVYRKNCHFIGVDNKESVITSSREMAKRLGYRNMEFINEDLRLYQPQRPIDMIISLHACDVATDYAIALGLRCRAESMVVVPCCHKELKEQIRSLQMAPLLKHGVFKTRFNDWLTDALRTLFIQAQGYEVSPLEYISPLDTPKNLMIRAVRTRDGDPAAKAEYEKMKEMFSVCPTMEKYLY